MNNEKNELMDFCKEYEHFILDERTYHACAGILFYTSWFEELLFNYQNRQGPKNSKKICKDIFESIDMTRYAFFGNHFAKRYIDDENKPTAKFDSLRFQRDDLDTVIHSLKRFRSGGEPSWRLLWSYLMIAYRFRNNMFHGQKGLVELKINVDEFEIINRFFRQIISDVKTQNYKGYNE